MHIHASENIHVKVSMLPTRVVTVYGNIGKGVEVEC